MNHQGGMHETPAFPSDMEKAMRLEVAALRAKLEASESYAKSLARLLMSLRRDPFIDKEWHPIIDAELAKNPVTSKELQVSAAGEPNQQDIAGCADRQNAVRAAPTYYSTPRCTCGRAVECENFTCPLRSPVTGDRSA